jgi:hypothetical protein
MTMEQHNCINIAKIATLENEIKNLKEQVVDLKDVKNSLAVLTVLQEESAKRDVARDKREEEVNKERKKQTGTLIVLSRMPEVVEKLDKKLDLQNEKLDLQNEKLQEHDEKFIDIDNKLANQNSDKVNKTEISKAKLILYGTIITVIGTTAATIIVALIK